MGITDAETDPRTKEEKPEFDNISRSTSAIGGEVSSTGTQQERIYREGGPRSSIFNPGARVTGKMLDHLINEYLDQVAAKQNEINAIQSRVKELKLIREELQQEDQE
ncbi:hypothetical protein [Fortiea contorta]|uniref:hypothetical protein n=1 Tax=Fortiea contorta TaxID=1892405 RepID=UPI00036E5A95|nr:hypothetical protein [Fortiea contorta]